MKQISPELKIAELSRSSIEIEELLKAIGASLDEIASNGAVLIVQSAPDKKTYLPAYVSKSGSNLGVLAAGSFDSSTGPMGYALAQGEDLVVPVASDSIATGDSACLLASQGVSSYIVRRIRLAKGECWGCLAIFFPFEGVPVDDRLTRLRQTEIWVQLATTIIERKLLEQALRVQEIRSELAAKASGVGIFDWDIESERLFFSPAMLALYGYREGQFGGRYEDWTRLVLSEDVERIQGELKEVFASLGRYFKTTQRIKHPNGSLRWIETFGEVIYNGFGNPIRLIGTGRDTTEMVRRDEVSTQDRRRLELALEAGELGFWDWSIESGYVQFGGQWGAMLGYSLEELPAHFSTWEKLLNPVDKAAVEEVLQKHLEAKSPFYESEHRLRAKDGSWVWVLARGRVIERDENGKALRAIGVHSNITQQLAVRNLLREGDRRKDEFLATLAHELRNPLAPLRTGLAIVKRNPASEVAARAREMMERQLAHMVRLVDDLLDVSRITTGRLTLKRESLRIETIIDLAVEASKPSIDAGDHHLSISLQDGDARVFGDLTRLSQVVSNILTNAAKYTPNGGTIEISTRNREGNIEILIKDNGLGIPPNMLIHVFDLFGQVNRTLDRSQGGLGIGLALVKSLVTIHGGEVAAYSEGEGKGSTFKVSLPLEGVATSPLLPATEPSNGVPARQKRVLIVDDNRDGAESLSLFTTLLGHSVEVSFTGADALANVAKLKPDVVFLDIGLPGMSGFEVAKMIRAMPDAVGLRLVAVTGWGSEDTKRRSTEAGFDEHLTKPVDLNRIEEILAAA
jgi:PAS domain S-box-containing protein